MESNLIVLADHRREPAPAPPHYPVPVSVSLVVLGSLACWSIMFGAGIAILRAIR